MGEQRLIDAGDLLVTVAKIPGHKLCIRPGDPLNYAKFVDVFAAIENAPTIGKRRNGWWIVQESSTGFYDICSECGKKYVHMYPHFDYCPNCGSYNGGKEDE